MLCMIQNGEDIRTFLANFDDRCGDSDHHVLNVTDRRDWSDFTLT